MEASGSLEAEMQNASKYLRTIIQKTPALLFQHTKADKFLSPILTEDGKQEERSTCEALDCATVSLRGGWTPDTLLTMRIK